MFKEYKEKVTHHAVCCVCGEPATKMVQEIKKVWSIDNKGNTKEWGDDYCDGSGKTYCEDCFNNL